MWKYLRIAVTAVSAIGCVLLIALWVRSYWRAESLQGRVTRNDMFTIRSIRGGMRLTFDTLGDPTVPIPWMFRSKEGLWLKPIDPATMTAPILYMDFDVPSTLVFRCKWTPKIRIVQVPHWLLVTITATIAVAPWFKWRFSLRTLLIVMTLFALFFGAIAWSL